jgi:hypothetical protein
MSLLDDLVKKYNNDIYKRHPKSKITVTIVYIVLLIILFVAAIRASEGIN